MNLPIGAWAGTPNIAAVSGSIASSLLWVGQASPNEQDVERAARAGYAFIRRSAPMIAWLTPMCLRRKVAE